MTDRLKVWGLDPAGGTAGQVPTINPAGTALEYTTPAGGTTDPEVVRDTIAAALVAGSNVSITPDDVANTITISATGAGGGGDATWTTPTFTNSWTDYGSPFPTAGYRKDGSGVVHLKGMVKNGTGLNGVFTLPGGYRPAATNIFPVISNDLLGQVWIDSAGVVTLHAGSTSWVSLAGISFYGV